jgi:transcriptional regulator with XRE-family HTH domain
MDYFGLSEWRKRLGLSIPKMARYVGTNINTWTKWEYGERSPSQAAQRLFSVLQHVERTCINLHKEIIKGDLGDAVPSIHTYRLRAVQKTTDTETRATAQSEQGGDFQADRGPVDR